MCEEQVVVSDKEVLSEEEMNERVEELRKIVLEHPDLSKMRTDDAFLLRFLHRTNFNVQKAYETVKQFYKYVTEETDWIALDIADNIKTFLDMNMRVMLPAVDKYGKKIFYMKTDTINPSKVTIEELNRLESLWMESVLDDPKVQATGLCLLMDVSGFSWRLMNWVTPTNIKRGIRKMECMIVKDATIHVVKSSKFMQIVINMAWPMLPNRIKERVKFHYNDLESLHKYISPDNLPKEYGGSLEVDFEALNRELLSKDEEIRKKLEHYRLISL